MLLSRLIWASHKCELHSDESVLQLPEKHVFPPLLQTPGANTCSRLLQEVLSMQLPTAHTKIKGCSDTNIVSELWGQTLESSILLVIRSQKVPKRTFNIVAYHLAHCNPLAVTHGRASVLLYWVSSNNPLYFKKGRTSSNQCNEPLQVTEGKKIDDITIVTQWTSPKLCKGRITA